MFGVLRLREEAIARRWRGAADQAQRDRDLFDERYDPVLVAVRAARKAAQELERLIQEHTRKVESGEIVTLQPNAVSISEGIDSLLHDYVSQILTQGVIALKAVQPVTQQFGLDIGPVFQQASRFELGMSVLQAGGPGHLEASLRAARSTWTESFIAQRTAVEHSGWVVPRVQYEVAASGGCVPSIPLVCGLHGTQPMMTMTF